jgi:HIV Tat-specific factor 1
MGLILFFPLQSDAPKTKKPRVNTAVWVTKIPLDAQKEEIREVFAKYGVIAEEIESGDARIKMYKDEDGNFTGEALVVYFRPESVQLAIQMLDETEFRFGVADPSGPMRVEVADSSYKVQQPDAPDKPKTSMKEKQKIIERNQRLNRYVAVMAFGKVLAPS